MTVYIYGLWDPRTYELRYIGKSYNPEKRLEGHIQDARLSRGFNPHKDRWINQLLGENLIPSLDILEECNEDNWEKIEDNWIQEARQKGANLVNIMNGGQGGSVKGRKLSTEAKKKISEGLKGRKFSEEHKRKIGDKSRGRVGSFTGRTHSQETKDKISKSRVGISIGKGIPKSPDHVRKVAEAKRGKPLSLETKKKISEAHKGVPLSIEHKNSLKLAAKNKPPVSEETKRKQSESMKGKIFTEEHKKNLSAALKGKRCSPFEHHSDLTKKKQSLIRRMNIAFQKNQIDKIVCFQLEYKALTGEYYKKFEGLLK